MKDDQKYLLAGLYSLLVAIFYFPLIESKGIFVSILMAVLLLYLTPIIHPKSKNHPESLP
ncbi:TPA: hypothetical protein ACS8YB_002110 [Streptococcus pneumoniae]